MGSPAPFLVQLLPVWVEGTQDRGLASPPKGKPAVGEYLDGNSLLLAPSLGSDLGLPSCCQRCLCVDGVPILVLLSHCPQKGENTVVSSCCGAGSTAMLCPSAVSLSACKLCPCPLLEASRDGSLPALLHYHFLLLRHLVQGRRRLYLFLT